MLGVDLYINFQLENNRVMLSSLYKYVYILYLTDLYIL